MDGFAGCGPHGFRVRVYDGSLDFKVRMVTPYLTADRSSMLYHVEGTSFKCTVRNDGSVYTFFSSQTYPNRQFFSLDTPIENVICSGFTNENHWLVPDDKEQPSLF